MPQTLHVAIDVGGTKLLAGACGDDGRWVRTRRAPTPDAAPLAALCDLIEDVRGPDRIDGIGIALPGPLDRAQGLAVGAPNLSAAWRTTALVPALADRYGCVVVAENDCNCAALAEARFGAGAGCPTVLYYTVSTGIGTGVVHGGRLITGRDDIEGGHHVVWPAALGGPPCTCGSAGCLEAVASGTAIRHRFGVPPEQLDDDGWRDIGHWLGIGVVNGAMFHDPDVVVVGGGIVHAWDRWAPSMMATVEATLSLRQPPVIRRAQLGEQRNLDGALLCLLQRRSDAGGAALVATLTANHIRGADRFAPRLSTRLEGADIP